jgi:hypothetical protein
MSVRAALPALSIRQLRSLLEFYDSPAIAAQYAGLRADIRAELRGRGVRDAELAGTVQQTR